MATEGRPLARIEVDGRWYDGASAEMTAAQILALAGHSADERDLYARGHHGLRIAAEDAVPVQDGSRFETRPRDDTFGAPSREDA